MSNRLDNLKVQNELMRIRQENGHSMLVGQAGLSVFWDDLVILEKETYSGNSGYPDAIVRLNAIMHYPTNGYWHEKESHFDISRAQQFQFSHLTKASSAEIDHLLNTLKSELPQAYLGFLRIDKVDSCLINLKYVERVKAHVEESQKGDIFFIKGMCKSYPRPVIFSYGADLNVEEEFARISELVLKAKSA